MALRVPSRRFYTSIDGDVIFAASINDSMAVAAAPDVVGAWGARVVAQAVLRAIRSAKGVPGLPAASEVH